MPEAETIVEAEVVETPPPEHPEQPPPPAEPSTAVVRRERRNEVIRPLDAETVVESFAQYQALLPRLLNESDYQAAEQGKRFVKKSGWRKIATAFDLDVVRVTDGVERDQDGAPVRAWATYRAIAPSGRTMDGDGYCSVDEPRFARAGGRQKLENDLRGTATTRAKNRAISDLVGMGEVSAEEVDVAGAPAAALPPWAIEATEERKRMLVDALEQIVGDREKAKALCVTVKESIGTVPQLLVMFARGVAASLPTPAETANAAAAAARGETPGQATLGDQLDTPPETAPRSDQPYPTGSTQWSNAPGQAEAWCVCPRKLQTPADEQRGDCPVHGIPF